MNQGIGIDRALALATGLAAALILGLTLLVVGHAAVVGASHLDLAFVTEAPAPDLLGGGIGPAIVGTALMTLLMTLAVAPIGIATGVYLAEYAPRRALATKILRAAVINLAGVPSIVFGLFGLGFFILFVGRGLDDVLHGGRPIWGTPSLLWCSLTLAILTLPVVIVTTEEALRAVPRDLRHAALAVGATRLSVVFRVTLPEARAGILTGLILAVGRGAGEVAPLLFCGAASYLPAGPTDVRDMFMHLGYHVYTLATQSPDVDAAAPVLGATVLVLLALTFALNLVAMVIRARTRRV